MELREKWAKRDPVRLFERFLEKRGIWNEDTRKALEERAFEEVKAAVTVAEATPKPGLETIFSDVFEDLPPHLRAQGQQAFDLAKRLGDAQAGDGAFPL